MLDYKTLEEVLTVIRHLTSVLSTAGMTLMDHVCPPLEQLKDNAEAQVNGTFVSVSVSELNTD